jgi:phosphoribosyl 1,2-cyclic phosphodiesterase
MPSLAARVGHAIREQMSPAVFPVSFDDVGSTVELRSLDHVERSGSLEIRSTPVRHPGGAVGFRIAERDGRGRGLVYISDNELGRGPGYDSAANWRESLVEFAAGAQLLVHDAMYTSTDYATHVGWGHSHYCDALQFALDAQVERLVLFHHSPERSDIEIDACVAECRAEVRRRGSAMEVLAAAEGMAMEV